LIAFGLYKVVCLDGLCLILTEFHFFCHWKSSSRGGRSSNKLSNSCIIDCICVAYCFCRASISSKNCSCFLLLIAFFCFGLRFFFCCLVFDVGFEIGEIVDDVYVSVVVYGVGEDTGVDV